MQSDSGTYVLDIAQLIDLAKNDPQAFETERKAALDNFFGSVEKDSAERLRRVQWRIERERERSANPMSACVKLNSMMWSTFSGEGGFVSVLNNPLEAQLGQSHKCAKIVPFKH